MFATLRYDQNSTLVEQADYIMACTNCRARKVRDERLIEPGHAPD